MNLPRMMKMHRKSKLNWLLMLLFVACLAGCGSEVPVVVVEQKDVWFNPPPVSEDQPETVPRSTYAPVLPERIAEAEEFLNEIGTSQISPSEVAYFVGHEMDMPNVDRPFLIRGLYRTKVAHSIRIVGNALWVASEDDPADSATLRRQPLVLIMQEVPELVYVTTGS